MSAKTILLVEDHRDSRDLHSTLLQSFGFEVVEAGDGREGVRLAHKHKPDVIVMDLNLPFMNGWEATRALKSDAETAHIPVIAVSAHAHALDVERAKAAGCDSFLAKPCTPTELARKIHRMVPEV